MRRVSWSVRWSSARLIAGAAALGVIGAAGPSFPALGFATGVPGVVVAAAKKTVKPARTTRKTVKTVKTVRPTKPPTAPTTSFGAVRTFPGPTSPAVLPTLPPTAPPAVTLPPVSAPGANTLAPAPTTTTTLLGGPTTVSPSSTTTIPALLGPNDFLVRLATPTKSAQPGETVSFALIAEWGDGKSRAATVVVLDVPPGASATVTPNPIINAAELRVVLPSTLPLGTYAMRLAANSNGVSRSTTATIVVSGSASTSLSSTTTTFTSSTVVGNPGFVVAVGSNSTPLKTGGAVSFPVVVNRSSSFTGSVTLSLTGLPAGVSGGFTDNPVTTTSTLWLSSTVALAPGFYTFNLVVTAGIYTQLVPLNVVLA